MDDIKDLDENQQAICWPSRHLVSLSCSHFVTRDGSDPKYFIISGFLVSMRGTWYLATASRAR